MTDLVVGSASWAQQALPDTPHPNDPVMYLDGSGSLAKQPFLFLGGPVLLDSTVDQALLKLYLAAAAPAGGPWTVTAKRITTPWAADDLTWNTRPTVDAAHPASVVVPVGAPAGGEYDLDLLGMLGDVAAGGDIFGVRLESSAAGILQFVSPAGAAAELKPALALDYRLPLDPPTNLNLGGGQATALGLPTLGWEFGPPDDVESSWQAKCRVQISTDGTFAGADIEYDSGLVANPIQLFDLANPPAGAPAYLVSLGAVTVTIASPAVFTRNAHGLVVGDTFQLTTTGALPTGLAQNTTYFVTAVPTVNTFRASATAGGADINTSGTQSGVHTLKRFGVADGAVRYWRVLVQDDKGQTTDWSEVA